MGVILVACQLGALAAAGPLHSAGVQAVEDPSSPVNSAIYLGLILLFTAFLLVIARLNPQRLITKAIFIFVIALIPSTISLISLSTLLPAFFGSLSSLAAVSISVVIFIGFAVGAVLHPEDLNSILLKEIFGIALLSAIYYAGWGLLLLAGFAAPGIGALVLAALCTSAAMLYPEWYVIDSVGLLVAIGITAILGVSLEVFPVLLLLAGLAVYDAIAVYRTRHMLSLADSAMKMKLPVMFVVPAKRGYSFLTAEAVAEDDRGAYFMGLGDVIMPGILTVSGYTFGLPAQAVGSLVGSTVGFLVLSYFVSSGKPQAGLPSLNGGAIAGYVAASLYIGAPLMLI